METVGTYEAKGRLSQLLDRVERGEKITITRRGRPVAVLGPVAEPGKADVRKVIDDFTAYSKKEGRTLGGMTIREMIDEGRRH